MKTQLLLSVFTALSASLCCVTPLVAIASGATGVASAFGWVEPFRPYFISATVLVLGFAWFQALTSKTENECSCERNESYFQSKRFLMIITLLALVLISFPTYSKLFFHDNSVSMMHDQDHKTKIEFAVKGMTCPTCELHIESDLKKISGVSGAKASYEKGSVVVEFDEKKTDKEKMIVAINNAGYRVEGYPSSVMLRGKENCTASSCQIPIGSLPEEINDNLIVLTDLKQIRTAFNRTSERVKFVAILSSTCKWCLQGAASVDEAIIGNMTDKDLNVIIVWTNMLQSDSEDTAFRAASLFKNKNITQFFDAKNKFGDVAAKAVNPGGKQAWDIYMFFDRNTQWGQVLPRPFEYVHQLGPTNAWADQTKYFCGNKLTERLQQIMKSL